MLIESFLTYLRCELNSSAHTVLSYSADICSFADFITGGKREAFDPTSVTVVDLRAWTLALAENGLGARSIRRKVSAMSTFYRWLMRTGLAKSNPTRDLDLARVPKRLPVFIRTQEIEQILADDAPQATTIQDGDSAETPEAQAGTFEQVRDYLILLMLYSTGMRRAELISLRDNAVDTAKGELRVLGKRNKERVIPFGNELAEYIERYRRLRSGIEGAASLSPEFFVRANGQPLYPTLVERIVKKALQGRTHATRKSPHTLRHSFASDMLNNGADIMAVQRLLGHKSLDTTQVYTHITYRELKQNYQLAHPRAHKI